VLRQIALTAGTRAALLVVGLATSIVTARFLGSSGRGEYYFMVTLAALVAQFANLGIPASNTFFAARDPQRTAHLFANSLWIALLAGGGLGAGVALFAQGVGMLQDTPPSYLWAAAALAVPTLFYLFATGILIGRGQIRAYNALDLAARGVLLPTLVVAGLAGFGPTGFVGVSVVVWLFACLAAAWLVHRWSPLSLSPSRELFDVGFRYAMKSYVITLLAFIALRGNIFLLRREYGPDDLGVYSIAMQIGDVLILLPQTVATIIFPHLVRDDAARWERTVRAAAWVSAIMLVICAVAAVAADPLATLLYGAEFGPSGRVLQVMLPSVFCLAVAAVLSQFLAAIGLPRPLIGVWALGTALVLALSVALIRDHGAIGAAAALSIGNAAILVGVAAVSFRYRAAPSRQPGPLGGL
jgi:O-antigen/teichoic acid export membrane protein